MASARKKQDEKHLKILRDLVSNPSNRQCFDCHQRGPTYVNMTIGSFVCTSCSGLLRGLTPPHRVKSISMATFTPEEIELISSRGNEYCRRIWLGLYEPGRMTETRDEQGIKDFMIAKYEKKRYYLDPSMANMNGATSPPASLSSSSSTSTLNSSNAASAISPIKPLSSLVGSVTLPVLSTVSNPIPAAPNSFTPDDTSSGFLVDFGNMPLANHTTMAGNKVDPFALPSTSSITNTNSNMNFADFDNNPIFGSSNGLPSNSIPTSQSFPGVSQKSSSGSGNAFQQPPAEDRYAALKDLDCLMKSQNSEPSSTQSGAQPDWSHASPPAPSWSAFGTSPQPGGFNSSGFPSDSSNAPSNAGPGTSNPFTSSVSNPWGAADGAVANPFLSGQSRQTDQSLGFAWNGNGSGVGLNGTSPLNGFHTNTSAFPTSQSLTFPSKSWNTEPAGNPFVMGPRTTTGSHSNNPFL
ncbi:arf-GAP domain and FG repeat-containing protein 1 isoform X2 [Frankliniella occidentalis]|uniref:Arf-GAP domain and FG repeat-containing protein 1 isoform X2 n=1 Tax=Frankliniella occidentalis TaxID=133901 RepID=A0A6J1T9M8_FRAOC|nr:arf-GAP domain and FG repeat-containing protein 1 isoform X2 [Frankliniella occidentalis]